MKRNEFKHRDINWLFFNERVLLEAENESTPLLERLKFLAIFSSNLDEFFKVRVSQLRQIKSIKKKLRKKLMSKANKTLQTVLHIISQQQEHFGDVMGNILSALKEHDIHIKKITELNQEQRDYVNELFQKEVRRHCEIVNDSTVSKLQDGYLYLTVAHPDQSFGLVLIPSKKITRFQAIPGPGHQYIYLDDIIKFNIAQLFPSKPVTGCYAIKMSRDAELYLEDDYTDNALVEKIYASLDKRKSGQPTRLLYDAKMPDWLLSRLKDLLNLTELDLFKGAAYHNSSDFFDFPRPEGTAHLQYEEKPPLKHPVLSLTKDMFEAIKSNDQLIHFPYQEFDVVENFIKKAAVDPKVTQIRMTIYRMAKTSVLSDALLKALENKKQVTLFVEAQARFDEKNNIKWGRIFEEKGAKVIFSVPNIKVHSKILMIDRKEGDDLQSYAYIGTGNFNAKTARIYCDHGLFTVNEKITNDLKQVFQVLERKLIIPKLKKLLVSPFTTRTTFMNLIQNEIDAAKRGEPARITAKMNSLEDKEMISALYRACKAGVEVRLLVRGFCCFLNSSLDKEENLVYPHITSIVDRFLEHGRIYLFENGGKEKMYIGSADWMTRNLDRRIEVLTPILDKAVFGELKTILNLQLNDTVKARVLADGNTNQLVKRIKGEPAIRSQYAIYDYLKAKIDEKS
jgi:polyphosphate kinase